MKTLTLIRPDDWHIHLRDGDALATTVPDIARWARRAIVMPNLVPPVRNVEDAAAYRDRILSALPASSQPFEPLMTLYLTDQTRAEDIRAATESGFVKAVKLYPAGATTNSAAGVSDLSALYPTIEAMEKYDLPLLIHGEVTDSDIDIFDREKVFIDRHLAPIVERFPKLRVVLEHITTADSVSFVVGTREGVGATITAHHLLYNRNHMLVGGIRPHYYCLPILKRNIHQAALRKAATSGNPRFFLGTDSAPHVREAKESPCGCAGCYTANAALEMYAEVFEEEDALNRLEAFASCHGPDFYRLPRNTDTVTLQQVAQTVPECLALGEAELIPLRAGETLRWSLVS
jgi:dihydroorotase